MNNLSMRKVYFVLFLTFFTIGTCNAQIFRHNAARRAERGLFKKRSVKTKEVKVKEPRAVIKAKKKQEAKEKKLKRDYAKSVKQSQKRSYEIQTPDVQARMKQNKKDAALRDKMKRKKVKSSSKKAGRKYK
jgi:hypothetical protein